MGHVGDPTPSGVVVGVLGVLGIERVRIRWGLTLITLLLFAEDSEQQLRLSLVKEKQIDK